MFFSVATDHLLQNSLRFLVRMQLSGVGEQGIRNDTACEHQSTGCPQAAL